MKYGIKRILLFPLNVLYTLSPKTALKILFRLNNGYKLNLDNPITYNEKLQWVKLNYRHPLLTKLVDKYTVREYVSSKCPEILNTLYWDGFDPEKIPWDTLPDKFVIKVTHGSGFNIICTDKSKLDKKQTERKLENWLKTKFLKCYGEWFYGVERPRIIIEKYLESDTGDVPEDYKIFCFNGEPKYIIVDTDRFKGHKRNVYDLNWNFKKGISMGFPNDKPLSKKTDEETQNLLKYAKILSEGFPHVRVDLYLINGKVYFGELTFTNQAGFDRITPYEFDVELGKYFDIKKETNNANMCSSIKKGN